MSRTMNGQSELSKTGRARVMIENVSPSVDGGRFEVKRSVGEDVVVEADAFADGHDRLRAVIQHRSEIDAEWHETEMEQLVNDRWRGRFRVHREGMHEYLVIAWVDHFGTWRHDLEIKAEAGQDVNVDLLGGSQMLAKLAENVDGSRGERLREASAKLADERRPLAERVEIALDEEVAAAAKAADPRAFATSMDRPVQVRVDRMRARFSTWYELFPRSASDQPGKHGTFKDVERRLSHIANLGFDVVYLPPIHPIGEAYRKGRNNTLNPTAEDVGSPWAIGGKTAQGKPGGHDAIHPQLGTEQDFIDLVEAAQEHGMEIALDIAFQCSPDHPWVSEHPEWFRKRADGTIQYAENPPKKYQDIYPIDFESEDWESLWKALRDVMLHWVDRGVKIFRVDNPHTKAFSFWEWAIGEIKERCPDVLFLSEAFTRPKLMYRLAKLGFTQSYTYFAWRNEPWEIEQYFTELAQTEVGDFFRPNAWPNTPDILTEELQHGGRPALMARLVLAATLSANYGIYGPPYEAGDVRAVRPNSEEYLDSEKYQLRHWTWDGSRQMSAFIARVNRIRHEHPALQQDRTLRFHRMQNEKLIAYSKRSPEWRDTILVIVNTDPHNEQSGFTELDLDALGLVDWRPFEAHDLMTNARYTWRDRWNFVSLNPQRLPAHIFHIHQIGHTEADRDHFA